MLVVVTGDQPEIKGRSRRTRTFRYLSRVAHEAGLRVFFTTPALFQVEKRGVARATKGWMYRAEDHAFILQQVRLDRNSIVIYDAMYLSDLKRHQVSYRRLYKAWRTFHYRHFNPILPAKDAVYRLLSNHDLGPVQLPATWMNVDPERVMTLLERYPRLWLKPVLGSGGRNIIVVERASEGRYHVVSERFFGTSVDTRLSRAKTKVFLANAMKKRAYMAQEDIPLLRTGDGRKVDFRVTLARAGAREWRAIAITGRVGGATSELTNFHAGGRAMTLEQLEPLLDVKPEQMERLSADLSAGGIRVARLLARKYKSLGLIGIDMGVTQSGDIRVYDFNGRPGRDILRDDEVNQAMDCVVRFAKYLKQDLS